MEDPHPYRNLIGLLLRQADHVDDPNIHQDHFSYGLTGMAVVGICLLAFWTIVEFRIRRDGPAIQLWGLRKQDPQPERKNIINSINSMILPIMVAFLYLSYEAFTARDEEFIGEYSGYTIPFTEIEGINLQWFIVIGSLAIIGATVILHFLLAEIRLMQQTGRDEPINVLGFTGWRSVVFLAFTVWVIPLATLGTFVGAAWEVPRIGWPLFLLFLIMGASLAWAYFWTRFQSPSQYQCRPRTPAIAVTGLVLFSVAGVLLLDHDLDLEGATIHENTDETRWEIYEDSLAGRLIAGRNLTGSTIQNTRMYRINLTGTLLQGAHLEHADLTRAILTRTDLRNAYLTQATLTGTRLHEAFLTGIILKTPVFDYLDLRGVNLGKASGIDDDVTWLLDACTNGSTTLPDNVRENLTQIDSQWRQRASRNCDDIDEMKQPETTEDT